MIYLLCRVRVPIRYSPPPPARSPLLSGPLFCPAFPASAYFLLLGIHDTIFPPVFLFNCYFPYLYDMVVGYSLSFLKFLSI